MKQLLNLLIIIAFALPAAAQSYIGFNGATPKSANDIEPKVVITEIANGKHVTIAFQGVKVVRDKQFTDRVRLSVPGCAKLFGFRPVKTKRQHRI